MKNRPFHSSRRHWCSFAVIGGLILLSGLGACSSGGSADAATSTPTIEVDATLPTRQTFHTKIAAFGQLVADGRSALALSLPQAGEIVAMDVVVGQRVGRGEVLLKLATDPAARGAYLQARSALGVARDDLVRTEQLRAGKLATNAQLDVARKALADAQTALDTQTRLGGAQASVALTAPAAGVVTALDVQRGQRAAAGSLLVRLAPASAMAAQLGVEPGAAADIRVGMRVTLVPVYAARGAQPLSGRVAMVGNAVDPQTRLVELVATLERPAQLAVGTALSASIDAASFSAWSVPRDALRSDARGAFVYQIERGKAKRVDVQVLAAAGSPVGVEGELDPLAPVIALGSYEVADGDPVRAAPTSSLAPPGTAAR